MTESERVSVKKLMQQAFVIQNQEMVDKIKVTFLDEFSVDIIKHPKYVLKLLEIAYEEKNKDDVEYILNIAESFKLFSDEYIDIFMKLIEADWHTCHEDIASLFQELKSPKPVECLYRTALRQFEYLDFDDSYALAVKCIWALGTIRNNEAIEKLKLLSTSDNEIIKENADYQLLRISEGKRLYK